MHFITNWQSRSREFYDTKVLLLKIKTKKRVKVKTLRGPDSHSRSRFSELGRALSANGIARFGDALFRFRSLLRARRSSPPIGRRSCERTRSVTWTRGKAGGSPPLSHASRPWTPRHWSAGGATGRARGSPGAAHSLANGGDVGSRAEHPAGRWSLRLSAERATARGAKRLKYVTFFGAVKNYPCSEAHHRPPGRL